MLRKQRIHIYSEHPMDWIIPCKLAGLIDINQRLMDCHNFIFARLIQELNIHEF